QLDERGPPELRHVLAAVEAGGDADRVRSLDQRDVERDDAPAAADEGDAHPAGGAGRGEDALGALAPGGRGELVLGLGPLEARAMEVEHGIEHLADVGPAGDPVDGERLAALGGAPERCAAPPPPPPSPPP